MFITDGNIELFITDGNIELFKGIGRDGMMGEGEPLYEMVILNCLKELEGMG